MADFTIFIGNKNYSSWSLRPWLALKHTGAAFEEVMIPLDQPDSAMNLRRRSPSGRVPVLQHGALTIWEPLAMFAPVTTRFVTHAMPLDPVCGACIAAMQRWPAMQDWAAAAKAEPWVINYDVNAGAA